MNKYYKLLLVLIFFWGCKNPSSSENGSIAGKVTENGIGVSNIFVKTVPSTQSVRTDAEGYYSINNVPPGEYRVVAFRSYYDSSSVKVYVKSNQKVLADIEINQYGSISGTIKDAKTQLVITDAMVVTNPNIGSAFTDKDGRFTISNIPAGIYEVSVMKFGYETKKDNIIVTSKKITSVNWSLTPAYGFIKGIVTDSIKPLVNVNITTNPSSSSVTSDNSGIFYLRNLSPGEYTITASKIGYTNSTLKVKVSAGDTTFANIIMKK
ncbi:MAG TPA: carboxypeptidase-like regulatory domain-containing protein [Ignavibacteriales bacterium]|nr:carboxypeptidase-like regulatory domain-containing protein [Ignavibacteriales bacterium]HOL80644.1 carboxypeptidase-like regulatory domain-containing protein [Ignavibacteriales bacterium]HOM64332.1 carboxypeptidase-like regulatory domain-containing protein [Ignavibacteriales bacterium]HPD68567.1 carboxypeptidase-like regulatory domain-containing protein [Ignavibacteriales bacterium]HPP33022.1 carboxypeptidase-like regulatory domain-containing protein [Ignavibacteriales bacterium]